MWSAACEGGTSLCDRFVGPGLGLDRAPGLSFLRRPEGTVACVQLTDYSPSPPQEAKGTVIASGTTSYHCGSRAGCQALCKLLGEREDDRR